MCVCPGPIRIAALVRFISLVASSWMRSWAPRKPAEKSFLELSLLPNTLLVFLYCGHQRNRKTHRQYRFFSRSGKPTVDCVQRCSFDSGIVLGAQACLPGFQCCCRLVLAVLACRGVQQRALKWCNAPLGSHFKGPKLLNSGSKMSISAERRGELLCFWVGKDLIKTIIWSKHKRIRSDCNYVTANIHWQNINTAVRWTTRWWQFHAQ